MLPHYNTFFTIQAEELRQHARTASDEGGLLRAELSKKDAVIASIEDQVATVSKTFEMRIEESKEKNAQLIAELQKLKSKLQKSSRFCA